MGFKKKILALSMIGIACTALLVGCGKNDNPKKVGMVLSTLNNPFFVSMKEGAQKEAERLGFELIILDSTNDPAKERANVEDLIELDVVALLINPTDSDAIVKTVEVANDANIPVITLDRQSNGGYVTSHIASDNVIGGEMAANYVIENLKDKEKINIVELQGIPGASATRDRGTGFHNVLDQMSNVEFVSSQSADFDRQKGLSVMENIIQGNPNFDVVFAHNDEMALGASKAIKAAGIDAMVIGFDGNEDAIEAIDKGEMGATVAQQPDEIGALGVKLANDIYNGKTVNAVQAANLKMYN